jgi:hypothetical protein
VRKEQVFQGLLIAGIAAIVVLVQLVLPADNKIVASAQQEELIFVSSDGVVDVRESNRSFSANTGVYLQTNLTRTNAILLLDFSPYPTSRDLWFSFRSLFMAPNWNYAVAENRTVVLSSVSFTRTWNSTGYYPKGFLVLGPGHLNGSHSFSASVRETCSIQVRWDIQFYYIGPRDPGYSYSLTFNVGYTDYAYVPSLQQLQIWTGALAAGCVLIGLVAIREKRRIIVIDDVHQGQDNVA